METFWLALAATLCYTMLVSITCNLFPHAFVSLFTSSPQLTAYTSGMMRFYITGFMIFAMQSTSQNTFVGLGQAGISLFFACFRKIILLIPFVYLLSATPLGDRGVFLAESLADSISAATVFITFMATHRRILANGAYYR